MKQVTLAAVEDYMQKLAACDTSDDVWQACIAFFDRHNFDKASYHVMPFAWETSDDALTIRTNGYPDSWVNHYFENKLWQIDPIASTAMNRSLPFCWSSLREMRKLSEVEQKFLDELGSQVEGAGYAVQGLGPNGRNGYFGLGLHMDCDDGNRRDLRVVQWACQLTHHRYCEMEAQSAAPLSRREQEVLSWVARGKSNSSIADILSISSYTVDAYMRRIYQKLGVNDRVSAAIQGLGSGLIKSAA